MFDKTITWDPKPLVVKFVAQKIDMEMSTYRMKVVPIKGQSVRFKHDRSHKWEVQEVIWVPDSTEIDVEVIITTVPTAF